MEKKIWIQYVLIISFVLLFGQEMHWLYATTKFLGEHYNSAYSGSRKPYDSLDLPIYDPQNWNYTGTFEGTPQSDMYPGIHLPDSQRSSTIGIDGSLHSFQLGPANILIDFDASQYAPAPEDYVRLHYISGAIDSYWTEGFVEQPMSDFRIARLGQWGEGREIMENYTHLGFFMYQQFEDAAPGDGMNDPVRVFIIEDDLMDTAHDLRGGQPYWEVDDPMDLFPASIIDYVSAGFTWVTNFDQDDTPDIQQEAWMAEISRDNPADGGLWKGWKLILLRLGRIGGQGENNSNFYQDDPSGDFDRPGNNDGFELFVGDGRFNIREIRGGIGNPHVDLSVDQSDTWFVDPLLWAEGTDERLYAETIERHFKVYDNFNFPHSTLPYEQHWVKGDVQGIKFIVIDVESNGSNRNLFTKFIDNVMFTTPILPGMNAPMHVDYTWLSDRANESLLNRPFDNSVNADGLDAPELAAPLERYEGFDLSTHYGSMWYEIQGPIPPMLHVKLGGGADLQNSSVYLYKYIPDIIPDDGTPIPSSDKEPLNFKDPDGVPIVRGLPNDGVDGLFLKSSQPLEYHTAGDTDGKWYTIVVIPRGDDGDETTASYGYAQAVNFRFIKPDTSNTAIDVLKAE